MFRLNAYQKRGHFGGVLAAERRSIASYATERQGQKDPKGQAGDMQDAPRHLLQKYYRFNLNIYLKVFPRHGIDCRRRGFLARLFLWRRLLLRAIGVCGLKVWFCL